MNEMQSLDPVTLKAPVTRIKDVRSLNDIVKKIIIADTGSALARQPVQEMADSKPPFNQQFLIDSGQEHRCNLNFNDGKRAIKAEMAGYLDLTDSVPMLANIYTDYGRDETEKSEFSSIISEEFHRTLKEWPDFDERHQLLCQKFCTHGVGFLYFRDTVDWHWQVSGLEDFKVPRTTTLSASECDIAVALRDVSVGKFYSWFKDVDPKDKRWNLKEAKTAILKAFDTQLIFSDGAWEKFEQILKNNDIWASTTAQEYVRLAHVWVKEFSGKMSQYLTLRMGGNNDFLYKCENLYDNAYQCFNFFPYEVGSNGTLHSVRGKGWEVYPLAQVLNSLRCQIVDNAKLAGSLLLQPQTAEDAENMAIIFYAGAVYIPPYVKVQNGQLNNPSANVMPIIQDMSLLLQADAPSSTTAQQTNQPEKTKFQNQLEASKESILPKANLLLFYQAWGRHLKEVWRRFTNPELRPIDPGGKEVWEFRRRCYARGVPKEAIFAAKRVLPYRAMGYGSPSMRVMALDEFLQYYGSLDPVGQNNLLRERFAFQTGWEGVDKFVPKLQAGGRASLDVEIAEIQDVCMSAGIPMRVLGNDNHILHLQSHLPSLDNDLTQIEGGQGNPQLLANVQTKVQHASQHIGLLKPDKLQEKVVAELRRQFNNTAERVQAAMAHAQRQAAKQQAQQAAAAGQQQDPKVAEIQAQGAVRRSEMTKDSELKRSLRQKESDLEMSIKDREEARKTRAAAGIQPQPIISPNTTPTPGQPPVPNALG
jgi:hypothetical protein